MKYVVHYDMQNPATNGGVSRTKSVESDTQAIAIQIARDDGEKNYPGYKFRLKKFEKQ